MIVSNTTASPRVVADCWLVLVARVRAAARSGATTGRYGRVDGAGPTATMAFDLEWHRGARDLAAITSRQTRISARPSHGQRHADLVAAPRKRDARTGSAPRSKRAALPPSLSDKRRGPAGWTPKKRDPAPDPRADLRRGPRGRAGRKAPAQSFSGGARRRRPPLRGRRRRARAGARSHRRRRRAPSP